MERIPQYCQDVIDDGLWKEKRYEYVLEPRAPEAWEGTPDIVAEAVNDFIEQQPSRTRTEPDRER